MTEKSHQVLDLIAARLELRRAEKAIRLSKLALESSLISQSTVRNVFEGRDHKISSLVEVAAELDLDVEIHFRKRM